MLDGFSRVRLHVVNVGHGDAMLLELPESGGLARFAVVDMGRADRTYRERPTQYLNELLEIRGLGVNEIAIDFVCITHPHEDHYGGLDAFLHTYEDQVLAFWDCGFRTTSIDYNKILQRIANHQRIQYLRVAAGFEWGCGPLRVEVLAPSLDLRNRFDTFGVDRNNASVVLRIRFKRSIAILAGDAQFDSWSKIVEEFPRTRGITYAPGASAARPEGVNQLGCQLLKVSHHGSKHGTSLEYLEKLKPTHFMITCAPPDWYQRYNPPWIMPHPLTLRAIHEDHRPLDIRQSDRDGNVVYSLDGSPIGPPNCFAEDPGDPSFSVSLQGAL